jgi:phosphoribosylglycinamide formyltransferase 1
MSVFNKKKLVVLISGNGSNLQAILDACASGDLNAEIVAVISNKENAFGLERAKTFSIPTYTKTLQANQSRAVYDTELAELVKNFKPDWIVLAGWMRILTNNFLQRFPDKIINLHPALPGMFAGTDAIARAFNAFQQGEINHTGVMVHLVPDEGVDCGPVLAQEIVPIYTQDTLEVLIQRVHQAEHTLLINALKKMCN